MANVTRSVLHTYDKKVPRIFREGDLVMKKILPFRKDPHGKFKPNIEGPYVVTRVLAAKLCIWLK